MKKVLIVHAHPEANSFNSALAEAARAHFEKNGAEVKLLDLYAMNFDPVGGKHDFKALQDPQYFKYQAEQLNACQQDTFADELKEHMALLEWCDVLIFNFPLWWFGLPAILKGWVDRVFAMGLVYGGGKGVYDTGVYAHKTAFLCLTTGGPEQAYNGGKNGDLNTILFPIQHGMFYFAGMTVMPPFIAFSPVRKTPEERQEVLNAYNTYLSEVFQQEPIYTNR
jgi:NAD(P)H dehydrogenase (quinone)